MYEKMGLKDTLMFFELRIMKEITNYTFVSRANKFCKIILRGYEKENKIINVIVPLKSRFGDIMVFDIKYNSSEICKYSC